MTLEQAIDQQQRLFPTLAPRRGIGQRLLIYILLFSSVVTLVLTALQLYFDYRRDVNAIETRLGEIERGYIDALAGSLWQMDAIQVRIQIEGILRLPDIRAVEVRGFAVGGDRSPLVVSVGTKRDRAAIIRELPIRYVFRGSERQLGVLRVEATLDEVYQRLADKAIVILVTQGIKTFLVSMFIIFIVWRLITRHLVAIAGNLHGFSLTERGQPLRLERRQPRYADELDHMVDAFNTMTTSLCRAWDNLRATNAALEQDIIARRRAEDEVNRLNTVLEQRVRQRTAELEAANHELSAFAYSVSHDLRAPLRRIDGFGRILIDEYGERFDPRGTHCLHRIQAGTREMAAMIDSFLKLSRATAGELTIEPVDLSALATTILGGLRERDPQRSVDAGIQPGLMVDGDRRLLRLALENLIDNAWKYSSRRERAEISFTTRQQDGQVVFALRDNGVGFDMAYAERLFTPFHRLHASPDFEGTGIGLATVQRILARHGGRIWAESDVDKGATFCFTCWDLRGHHEQPHDSSG